jgi:transcriptional regulator with XRE-family HTH domain
LTQDQLAERLDVYGRGQISLWENGRRKPSAHFLIAIAAATGHDVAWFYTDHEDAPAAAAAT